MAKNIQKSIDKWKANAAAATAAIKDGVMGVTVAPTALAAAAVDKYAAGTARAVSDGTFVDGCNGTSLADWQQSMITKGAANAANGVRNLSAKAQRNMADVLAYTQQVSQQIQSMPNSSEGDADARMLANVAAMRAYRGGRR